MTAVFLLLAGGFAQSQSGAPESVVQRYLEAYNSRELGGMLQLVSDDIAWMMVSGDDVEVVSRGKRKLADAMAGFFAATPSGRSDAIAIHSVGRFVSVVEQAAWQSGDSSRTQCALSVYEIRDGFIAKVWYYSEQPCPQA